MKKNILEFKKLSYSYDDEKNAIEDVDLTITECEKIAVLGNNGSGKSTFFLCCNGVLAPQKGEILLFNNRIKQNKKDLIKLRTAVGIVFQDPNQQFIGTTVFDDISFGALNIGLDRDLAEEKTLSAMRAMNLDELGDRPPHYLSGGEKRRLSIADILAMNPDVILFDEPTAFLDLHNIEIFENTLDILHNQSKTLVVSTHDVDFAYRWADRIIVFSEGKVFADDTPQAVFENETLLTTANLKQPQLLKFFNAMVDLGLIDARKTLPKTLEQLMELLSKS